MNRQTAAVESLQQSDTAYQNIPKPLDPLLETSAERRTEEHSNGAGMRPEMTERMPIEMSLCQSETQLASIFQTIPDGVLLLSPTGQILMANKAAERILRLTGSDLTSRTYNDPAWAITSLAGQALPEDDLPFMQVMKTGKAVYGCEHSITHSDGMQSILSINASPLLDSQGQISGVVAAISDISERVRVEAERQQAEAERIKRAQEQTARVVLEEAYQQSAFLAEVSSVLASSLEYEQTLQSVANLAVPYFADWCSVDLLNPDHSISRVAVSHRDPEKVAFGWEISQRFPRYLHENYGISRVMQTGRSEIVPEITDEMLVASISDPAYLEIMRGVGLRSCIISPLEARGRILGSISFVFAESNRRYRTVDLALAEDLARRAAISIDNARLFQETQRAQQAAEIAASRTARLQTVTAALSESLTPLQVAEVIVEQSMAALGAVSALVALVTPDQRELEIIKAVGYTDQLVEQWRRFSINSPVPLAEAVRTAQPVWLETRATRIARYPHLASIYNQYGFNAWMSLPLVVEGRSVGGMLLNFNDFKQFSQDDRNFILVLSRQCAQAISRAKLYEAERQARAEAEQANRVKDEFLAVLSHELRSPLNPILGWAGLLRSGRLTPAKTTQAVEIIERNAKLQVQLIEDLLDVSRILRGKLSLSMVSVSLVSTIEAALETVRLAAEAKTIQIERKLAPGDYPVLGDAARIQQIVWNLLFNAIKFTPNGGRVEIRLDYLETQAQIKVSDTGKGIHPDFLPYIFDTFRQADSTTTRTFGGLGLGLAIVRHLVELHGGTVQAESPGEGLGATLTVCFPLLPSRVGPESAEPTNALPPADALPLKGLTLLMVDDDLDTRDVITFTLEQAGAFVTATSSVTEALQKLRQFSFDLLLSDIGMPEQDGYALIRQVRALPSDQGGGIPAIALTAYASEFDQQQALSAGFQKHLSKPIDPDQLVSAIARLAYSAAENH
ncbi:MAG TPA: ATP-binding protein [Trichocoleus sp.]